MTEDSSLDIPYKINLPIFLSSALDKKLGAKKILVMYKSLLVFRTSAGRTVSYNDIINPTCSGDENLEVGFVLEYVLANWEKIKEDAIKSSKNPKK
jgi:hypothetical protein